MDALAEYERYKKERGLIDYTDMEVLVSQLLDQPTIQEVLRSELDLLMVDEFQDTSPIQLEIFLKLSKFAKASVWVGDPKQSIYGFRGAAPELMEAIIKDQGGVKTENIQKHSWRSREDLVFMTNALFTKAFPDLPKDQVALIPKRRIKANPPETSNKMDEPISFQDPIFHWHFEVESDGSKRSRRPGKPWMENAIAATIKTYLERNDLHFWHRSTGAETTLSPGDIAVLCRSNAQCQEVADALHRMGLKAAISRAGLLQTAEAKLILACLKFMLNRNDSLSIAEILLLAEGQSIEAIIQNRLDYLDSPESEGYGERWAKQEAIIGQLNELRKRCADYSSAETLDTILEELEVRRIAASWGNVQQRFDNIDRLRYFAQQYEEACNRMYTASSLGGFLLWLIDLERNGQDLQASGESPDAVNVLTYHRSKGLEWPMVICHSLDQNLRADVWGLEIVPEVAEVDIQNLLGNRWLRYWINPYDRSLPGTYLAECLETSPIQRQKKQKALQEESRLLYVGLTRARDYIVFPTSSNPSKWLNRTWHNGQEDYPTLDSNTIESPWEWDGRFLNKQTEAFVYPKVFSETPLAKKAIQYWENRAGRQKHPLYSLDPVVESEFQIPELVLGQAIPCGTSFFSQEAELNYPIAKAIKAYLTSFHSDYEPDFLVRISEGIIDRYDIEGHIDSNTLQKIAGNWTEFLTQGNSTIQLKRKVPLHHFHQQRHFQTYLDYVVIESDRIRIYQSSGGHQKKQQATDKAKELAPWFFLVQEAYQKLYPDKQIETFLHMVLQGLVLQVEFKTTQ
ncbi:MAG: UvrD-helicase domain-containing protein, partial [Bacteroidota bacterium]